MAQNRVFEYLADDATFAINQQYLGVIQPGIYRGFDVETFNSNLILDITHGSTGFAELDINENEKDVGIAITRQGVVVREDQTISLPINSTTTLPRIDIVVLSHRYIATDGGQQAVYSVIQGTPAGTPVAPGLTNDKRQIKVGELYLPANCSNLSSAGVVWTRSTIPDIADNTELRSLINAVASDLANLESQHTADIADISNSLNDLASDIVDLNAAACLRDNNLGDVSSAATSRTNLNVYSKTEADAAIGAAIDALIDGAPTALNTLAEIASSIGNDEDFVGTVTAALATKVDKITGKGLSTNDFTDLLKNKLEGFNFGIATGDIAEVGSTLADSAVIVTDGSGKLATETKKSAHNKTFGAGIANVPKIGSMLAANGVLTTTPSAFLQTETKNSAHNKNFGTASGTVAEGDHNHQNVYEAVNNTSPLTVNVHDLTVNSSGETASGVQIGRSYTLIQNQHVIRLTLGGTVSNPAITDPKQKFQAVLTEIIPFSGITDGYRIWLVVYADAGITGPGTEKGFQIKTAFGGNTNPSAATDINLYMQSYNTETLGYYGISNGGSTPATYDASSGIFEFLWDADNNLWREVSRSPAIA